MVTALDTAMKRMDAFNQEKVSGGLACLFLTASVWVECLHRVVNGAQSSLQPPSSPLRPECCKPWELCAGPAPALVASMAHSLGDHERDREALLTRSPSPLPQLPTQAPHGAGLTAARRQRWAGGDLTQNRNSTPCCWSSSLPRAALPVPPRSCPCPVPACLFSGTWSLPFEAESDFPSVLMSLGFFF